MFKNPVDKLIKYTNDIDIIDLILVKGGKNSDEDDSSSSDEEEEDMDRYIKIETYASGGLKKNNLEKEDRTPKFNTIVNLLSKKAKTRPFTKYEINEIKIDKKNPVKLFVIFDAYQFKKKFKKTTLTREEIFEIIKKNDSLIMMCGNTSNMDFKFNLDINTKSTNIFKEFSIPMVAIFSLHKDLKYYEEYSYESPKGEKIYIKDDQVLIYKMVNRIICSVRNLKNNLTDFKLFYIDHQTDDVKLVEVKNEEIFKKYEQIDANGHPCYRSLSLHDDLPKVFSLIYPMVTKFKLIKIE
jgi:hypothetical protein